jgi:hypothetical protein
VTTFRSPDDSTWFHHGHLPVGRGVQEQEQEQLHLQAHGLWQTQEQRFIEMLIGSFPISP